MKDMPDDSLYAAVIEYFMKLRKWPLTYIKEKHFGHVKQFNYVTTRLLIDAVEQQLPKYINLFKQHSGKLDWRLLPLFHIRVIMEPSRRITDGRSRYDDVDSTNS